MLQVAATEEQRQRYLEVLERECLRETKEICLSQRLPQLLEPFRQRVQSRQLTLDLRLPVSMPTFVCHPKN